jgi:acetyl-CoA carboxylase biotin carboxylase subunit
MAKSEAKSAFNNDAIFIEKFIEEPRHIEIQILGDKKGNVIHLFERECSIQRRHQKVVEEAPSPGVSEKTRKKMGAIAVKLAKKVSYHGAGTVEFIMDQKENFYFLEMNTRVQVEHPITEMITGIDIVKEMIRISCGHKLSIKQKDVSIRGHAIECRICAEDPDNNFLPTPGTINYVKAPQGPGVRIDSSLFNGYKVTTFYDPMLAKIIVWGQDRHAAIQRMGRALSEYVVLGVRTNIGFLIRLMEDKDFFAGQLDTGFIEKHKKLLQVPKRNKELALIGSVIIMHTFNGIQKKDKDSNLKSWKHAARASSISRSSAF